MSEIKQEAKVYLLDYLCDKCGKGKMVRDGQIILTCHPPKFPHKCESCGDVQNFIASYPTPKFELVCVFDHKGCVDCKNCIDCGRKWLKANLERDQYYVDCINACRANPDKAEPNGEDVFCPECGEAGIVYDLRETFN